MAEVIICNQKILKDGKLMLKFSKVKTYENSSIVKKALEEL